MNKSLKLVLRVLALLVTSPIWLPFWLFFVALSIAVLTLSAVYAALTFAFCGEWDWPLWD